MRYGMYCIVYYVNSLSDSLYYQIFNVNHGSCVHANTLTDITCPILHASFVCSNKLPDKLTLSLSTIAVFPWYCWPSHVRHDESICVEQDRERGQ